MGGIDRKYPPKKSASCPGIYSGNTTEAPFLTWWKASTSSKQKLASNIHTYMAHVLAFISMIVYTHTSIHVCTQWVMQYYSDLESQKTKMQSLFTPFSIMKAS